MKQAYYIEEKNYWTDAEGEDYQMADGGELPIVYTSLKKASSRLELMVKIYMVKKGYNVVTTDENHPAKKNHCLHAWTLESSASHIRVELRLYRFFIH